jgi:opacity protein-like surface antigen
MAAVYVDLPRIGPAGPLSPVPFLSAGVGVGRTVVGEMRQTFPRTTTLVPGGDSTGIVWMATAGIAVPVADGAMLDFAWRYEDLGLVETGRGAAR